MIKSPSSILTTPKDATYTHAPFSREKEKEREKMSDRRECGRKTSLMVAGRTRP